jgi:glycosyltransferase involved in cell wall biosynthesis
VNKLYSPWIGGVETTAQDIAECLHAADGIDCLNLVCQPSGKRKVDSVNGVTTYRANSWGMLLGMPLSLDFFVLFRKLASNADVVILHHPFPLAFVAYWLYGKNKKVVVWYHSDIIRQKIGKLPFLPFIRHAMRKADHVVVSTRAIIRSSRILAEFAEKCRIVDRGVDVSKFAISPQVQHEAEQIRRRFGAPLVLSVGRLVYYKGFSYLIDAMKEVHAHLLIIGDGPLKANLVEQIAKTGLQNRIHLMEPVDNLVPYYHACDAFALPSCESSETYGVVQIEALACGKPVVNTDLPSGVPEVSVGGVTGFTVPSKDAGALAKALRSILEDGVIYQRFSENARKEVATRFTMDTFNLTVSRDLRSTMTGQVGREETQQDLSGVANGAGSGQLKDDPR